MERYVCLFDQDLKKADPVHAGMRGDAHRHLDCGHWPGREAKPPPRLSARSPQRTIPSGSAFCGIWLRGDAAERGGAGSADSDEFDEVFTQYNDLQKTAGMDLEPYHGKRVKCWTYTVLNYPGEEGVLAHLYIYKDKIVGGDVSSTALDGFMHGLTKLGS